MRLPAGVQRNEYTMFNRSASPASGSQQQYQTFGGGASDPRWSHNGGTWQSGQQPARQGGGSSAYSPGQAQSQQSPYAGSTPYAAYAPAGNNAGQQQNATDMSAWAMPKQQLLQWGQMQPQVPALQPQQGMTPAQTWDTVSAVIGQVNNTAANQQVGTYLGDGAPPAGWGQTSYNPQQLWSQATDMVSQGWQNPLAPQSPPPPPPAQQDPVAWIRSLLQGGNRPSDFMAQLQDRPMAVNPAPMVAHLEPIRPPYIQPSPPPPPPGVPSASPGQAQPAQDPYAGSTPYGRPLGDALQTAAAAEPRRDVTFEQWKSMRDKALGPSPRAPRRPPPPPPSPAAPAPRPAQRRRPAANPFAGKSVALPAGMKPSQFTRQLDGSYLPNGVTQRPSMTRRQPRVINWSEMTQEEIANTRSPYLGGRRPSINGVPVGKDSQYGRRLADVLQPPPQPAQPRRDPRDRGTPSPRSPGYYSPMPAGTPPSLAPFYDQAQQLAPGADPFQVRELAYRLKNMQP